MLMVEGSSVMQRAMSGEVPLVNWAMDTTIATREGNFTDLSGGAAVTCLGHSNAAVQLAISNQLHCDPYIYSGFGSAEVIERLGDILRHQFERTWPGWFGKALFLCSGGEAVEAACKIAAQYRVERGEPRRFFAARQYSYHGTSFFTLALGDHAGVYSNFAGTLEGLRCEYIKRLPGYEPYPSIPLRGIDRNIYEVRMLNEIDAQLAMAEYDVNAVVVETVGGPTAGVAPPSASYLKGLRSICDDRDTLLIFDEVMCGVGRTGDFTAAQRFGVRPDIIVLGKGLTGGYLPLSAVIVSKRVSDTIKAGSGLLWHGTSFMNHAPSCAAAVAALTYMSERDMFQRVKDTEDIYDSALRGVFSDMPVTIRGLGRLWGIEFGANLERQFKPEVGFHARVKRHALAANLGVYTKGGTVHGAGDYVLIAPSYEMDPGTFVHAVERLRLAASAAYEEVLS